MEVSYGDNLMTGCDALHHRVAAVFASGHQSSNTEATGALEREELDRTVTCCCALGPVEVKVRYHCEFFWQPSLAEVQH